MQSKCENLKGINGYCALKTQQKVNFTFLPVSDINECQGNTDNCHDNATCSNNEGSFDCQCIQGYTGDGTNCEGK
jgi:hypothetical protein